MTTGNSSAMLGGGSLSRPPTTLIGSDLTAAATILNSATEFNKNNIRVLLSGALTADTYKTMVSVTGAGVLNFASVQTVDATSRNIYCRITIDGTVVATRSSLTTITATAQVVAVGGYMNSANGVVALDAIPFNTSLLIEIKSSLTETDKLNACFVYRTI